MVINQFQLIGTFLIIESHNSGPLEKSHSIKVLVLLELNNTNTLSSHGCSLLETTGRCKSIQTREKRRIKRLIKKKN